MNHVKPLQIAKDRNPLVKIVENQWKRPSQILRKYLTQITGAEFETLNVVTVNPQIIFAEKDYGSSASSHCARSPSM